MRYAIVESGGKQYRAVEGQSIDVDRLSSEQGAQVDIERILLMADGEEFLIGTPTVSGINVKATVVEHFRGPKVFRFKYSPKKRIRVRRTPPAVYAFDGGFHRTPRRETQG